MSVNDNDHKTIYTINSIDYDDYSVIKEIYIDVKLANEVNYQRLPKEGKSSGLKNFLKIQRLVLNIQVIRSKYLNVLQH